MSTIPDTHARAAGVTAAAIDRLRPALWRYACVLGADAATADDLVQEALLVALQRPGFEADDPAAAFAFLRTTVRHRWLKHVRRCNTRREVENADEVWDEQCGAGDGDAYVVALRECVAALPPRGRELLRQTYEHGAGRVDAARALGLTEHGVKSALRRLRGALRRCIERKRSTER